MVCDDAKIDSERKKKDIGMCAGDSGGPLVIKEDNIYYQIGTVGGYSGDADSPLCGKNSAYYGSMSYHNKWINSVLNYKASPSIYKASEIDLSSLLGYYYLTMKKIPKIHGY